MTTAERTIDSLLAETTPRAIPPKRSAPSARDLLGALLLGVTAIIGVAAYLYPFWAPALAGVNGAGQNSAHAADAPLMLSLIVLLCFAVLLVEVQAQAVSAKAIALLGVLVAINSVLRFAEVAIPGPGGFSLIFLLIITGGYIFGARIGFLLGALSIVASALITGGVGPWMPYQMLTAGWVGMTAPLCRPVVRWSARVVRSVAPRVPVAAVEVAVLAIFGALWGLIFGMVMNLWFWPYAVGSAATTWQPGEGVGSAIRSYALFYAVTSLAWDLLRAVGNVLLLGVLGAAVLRILRRFQQRFDFAYTPLPALEPQAGLHAGPHPDPRTAPRAEPHVAPHPAPHGLPLQPAPVPLQVTTHPGRER
jgi:energy-coupling factor transport system substrate-specific component